MSSNEIVFISLFALYDRGRYSMTAETLQSRGEDSYELWLTARHCIRSNDRVVVMDDVLDNGSPLAAALMIVQAAGRQC